MHYSDIELKGIDKTGEEKNFKLSDFKGNNVILYFYPMDDTPVCTKEAHEFNEALKKLNEFAFVIGVSSDDIKEHKEFQKKHELNFPLLSDIEGKLKKAIKDHFDKINNIQRSTFIINKDGEIIKYWEKVDVDGHIDEILEYFKQ